MESFVNEIPDNVKIIKSQLPISDFTMLIDFETRLTDDPNFRLTAVTKGINMIRSSFSKMISI